MSTPAWPLIEDSGKMMANGVSDAHGAWPLTTQSNGATSSGVGLAPWAHVVASSSSSSDAGGAQPSSAAPLLGPPLLGEAPSMQAIDALAFQTARMQLGGAGMCKTCGLSQARASSWTILPHSLLLSSVLSVSLSLCQHHQLMTPFIKMLGSFSCTCFYFI